MTLIFYDGVCALCNGMLVFLLKRDRGGVFRFAPLQGELARRVLPPTGVNPADLDSMVIVDGWNSSHQRVLTRSAGVLHALTLLGGAWGFVARAARVLPRPLTDALYRIVARSRYRVFGKLDACPLPPPEWRDRFIE